MSTTLCMSASDTTPEVARFNPFDVAAADALSPGCAAHGRPDCLCDVAITDPVPMERVPASLMDVETADEFVEWAERMAVTLELGLDFDLACQARDEYENATDSHGVRTALRHSIEAGLTLAQTLNFWEASSTSVMAVIGHVPEPVDGTKWLHAERLLGTTLLSYKAIALDTGLSFHQVKRLSEELLSRAGRSPRRRFMDRLQAQARAMRARGMTPAVIAKRLSAEHGCNVTQGRVDGWVRADRQPQVVAA